MGAVDFVDRCGVPVLKRRVVALTLAVRLFDQVGADLLADAKVLDLAPRYMGTQPLVDIDQSQLS